MQWAQLAQYSLLDQTHLSAAGGNNTTNRKLWLVVAKVVKDHESQKQIIVPVHDIHTYRQTDRQTKLQR